MVYRVVALVLSVSLLAMPLHAVGQTPPPLSDNDAMYNLLYGFMLSESKDHNEVRQGAMIVGEVGSRLQNTDLLRKANDLAIEIRDMNLAKQVIARWLKFGGLEAVEALAKVNLYEQDFISAKRNLQILLDKNHTTQEQLFILLAPVRNNPQVAAMSEGLFLDNAVGRRYVALLYYAAGNTSTAIEQIDLAIAADKGDLEGYFVKASIRQVVGGSEAALPIFERFVKNKCYGADLFCNLDAMLWAYSQYLNKRPWRQSLDRQLGEADPQGWALSAAHWYQQWGKNKLARRAYQRSGDLFMAKLGLAMVLDEEGKTAAALQTLQDAKTETQEDFVRRETTIAHLLQKNGELPAAIDRLVESDKVASDDFSILYNLALLYETNGEVVRAIETLNRLTKSHPDNAESWNALGYVMADNNVDLLEAKRYIEMAAEKKPNSPDIIDSLGWVYYRLGQLERALFYLKKASELSTLPEIWAHLGEVLWQLGDKEEAKRVWKKAHDRDADNKTLNETIERLSEAANTKNEAEQTEKKADGNNY